MELDKKKKFQKFLILSILGLILINLPLISAYIILIKFGTFTLYPGEKYTINIPFIGSSKFTTLCGKAQQTDGTLLEGINVTIKYFDKTEVLAQNLTNKDGKFCVVLPNITSSKKFDVYVGYDNSTLTLASNDYSLNFNNYKVYNKSKDSYVSLTGDITNEDAEIENGRFEINLQYYMNSTNKSEIFDYQKYSLNIEPYEVYDVPNPELSISWPINSSTIPGRYK